MSQESRVDDLMGQIDAFMNHITTGDSQAAVEVLVRAGEHDPAYFYTFLAGLAHVAAACIKHDAGVPLDSPTLVVSQAVDFRSGTPVNPEESGTAAAFAMRFVTAAANGQSEFMLTLWGAVQADPGPAALERAAAALVGVVARLATRNVGHKAIEGGDAA